VGENPLYVAWERDGWARGLSFPPPITKQPREGGGTHNEEGKQEGKSMGGEDKTEPIYSWGGEKTTKRRVIGERNKTTQKHTQRGTRWI